VTLRARWVTLRARWGDAQVRGKDGKLSLKDMAKVKDAMGRRLQQVRARVPESGATFAQSPHRTKSGENTDR
jgi:hypothetical protein